MQCSCSSCSHHQCKYPRKSRQFGIPDTKDSDHDSQDSGNACSNYKEQLARKHSEDNKHRNGEPGTGGNKGGILVGRTQCTERKHQETGPRADGLRKDFTGTSPFLSCEKIYWTGKKCNKRNKIKNTTKTFNNQLRYHRHKFLCLQKYNKNPLEMVFQGGWNEGFSFF